MEFNEQPLFLICRYSTTASAMDFHSIDEVSITFTCSKSISYAPLVQLDRIPDYGSDDEDSSSSRGTD